MLLHCPLLLRVSELDSIMSNQVPGTVLVCERSCQVARTLTDSTLSNTVRESEVNSGEREEEQMVGVVVVSHSAEIARGVVEMAGQMAGDEVRLEGAGGDSHGTLGTDEARVRE